MIREVTNNNVHLLIPGKVAHFVRIYTEEHDCSILDALRVFYSSGTYRELEDETTKLWHLGPVALYEAFAENQANNI